MNSPSTAQVPRSCALHGLPTRLSASIVIMALEFTRQGACRWEDWQVRARGAGGGGKFGAVNADKAVANCSASFMYPVVIYVIRGQIAAGSSRSERKNSWGVRRNCTERCND